jgi:hypothetical protein
MPDPFAVDTKVPVHKSRDEIQTLLRAWGCTGIQWTDDYEANRVSLRFRWPFEETVLMARVSVPIPSKADLLKGYPRLGRIPKDRWADEQLDQRVRTLHRILLLKLRADFNAVREGLFTSVEAMLPYLEGADGRTVGETARERVKGLLSGSARALLEGE